MLKIVEKHRQPLLGYVGFDPGLKISKLIASLEELHRSSLMDPKEPTIEHDPYSDGIDFEIVSYRYETKEEAKKRRADAKRKKQYETDSELRRMETLRKELQKLEQKLVKKEVEKGVRKK